MIKAEAITEIPFLPYFCLRFRYSPTDIFSILKKKITEVQKVIGGETIVSDHFLEMTAKREYSKFQDIRKVIGLIKSRY